MFCAKCGGTLPQDAENCPACGQPAGGALPENVPVSKLAQAVQAAATTEQTWRQEPARTVENPQDFPPPSSTGNLAGSFAAAQPGGGTPPPPYGTVPGPAPTPHYNPAPGWSAPAPAYGTPPAPGDPAARQKKKMKAAAIAAGAVGVLVVLLLVIYLVFTRANPAGIVTAAIGNSLQTVSDEMEKTYGQLGLSAFDILYDGPASMEMDVGLEIAETDEYGIGPVNVRVGALIDLPERRMDMDFGVGAAGASLLDGTLYFSDDMIALSIPALYQGSYGAHTETLGADFNRSNLRGLLDADKVDPALSFNYFDLMGAGDSKTEGKLSVEMTRMLADLWAESRVERAGKQTAAVNGNSKSCEVYTITVPQAAAKKFLGSLATYLQDSPMETDELMAALEDLAPAADAGYSADSMVYYLETMESELSGDVTCDVFVEGDKAVMLDALVPMSEEMNIRMELGGEKHLSDAFAVEISRDGESVLQFSAQGSHVMEDGIFTTAVEVQAYDDYEEELVQVMAVDVEYDSAETLDNLTASATVVDEYGDAVQVSLTGTVEVFEGGVRYDLYEIELDNGGEVSNLSVLLALKGASAGDFEEISPTLLLDMKLLELTELQEELQENAMELTQTWMSLMYA